MGKVSHFLSFFKVWPEAFVPTRKAIGGGDRCDQMTGPAEYFEWQRRFKDEEVDLDVTRGACKERVRWLELLAESFPHPRV
jgi:hypothetical protein